MEGSDDSEEENGKVNQDGRNRKEKQSKLTNINELLRAALAEADKPGEGDEEPIILDAPGGGGYDMNGKTVMFEDDFKVTANDIGLVKQKAIEDEERKVAEMVFDIDDLIPSDNMEERCKYIPLRLTYEERKSLRLVNATINVSNYTNVVDQPFKTKTKRQHAQLQSIVSFLSGLIASIDYSKGQEVILDRNFSPYQPTIQQCLEIARRYKIINPSRMRSEYGKLLYLMQDADSPDIKQLIGVEIHKPIKTVYDVLAARGGLEVLNDSRILTATEEILPDKTVSKNGLQMKIKRKETAIENIVHKYSNRQLPEEVLRLCLYSISDNNSFLNSNLKPIQDCIGLLEYYFSPSRVDPNYSLSISAGNQGARLTHSHEAQYNYVLQSLTLWAAIVEDMFRLWYLAEVDLLSDTQSYDLRNTGQGLQRVKESPKVYRAMHEILVRTKQKLGGWVGSSVIHLGDNNVPNTLVFIDKYTQVPRILGPLVKTFENLESACNENEGLKRYMQAYGGIEKAKKDILHDFFTHAFDGSGGDNFFDAGSCIDGRLTSAWHWCSQLSSKPYYPLFRLTGFLSFDGQFDN